MEFYFSDSNLRNDRYMKQLMMRSAAGKELVGDEPVPLSEIVQFNKIRCLTTNEEDLRRALRSSDVLALAPDGSSLRRKQVVDLKKNVDSLTVYVENLPDDVSHDWLTRIFSVYGTVTYISIPKFKDKRSKGFAFIEFSAESAVRDACRAFRAQVPPEKQPNQSNESAVINSICETETEESGAKRKLESPELESSEEPEPKKSKTHISDACLDRLPAGDDASHIVVGTANTGLTKLNLRVMSKQEWNEWKRKYKQLQMENMRKVKHVIRAESEAESAVPSTIASKLANLMNAAPLPEKTDKLVTAHQGDISVIKLSISMKANQVFEEAVFKKRIRELADPIRLAYVDVDKSQIQFLDDDTVVHICFLRCTSRSDADCLIKERAFQTIGTATVLEGDDVQCYRVRMHVSRQRKHENKNHKGYSKWVQKAGKVLESRPNF